MKVKTLGRMVCLTCIAAFLFITPALAAGGKEKVILDADMVDSFDDGVAMIMLANAPGIDLIGVTTLTGNSWAAAGLASAIKQLEIEGATSVPVAMGFEYPLRPGRHAQITTERKLFGMGHDSWLGSFGLEKPKSWQEAYTKTYGGVPTMTPDKRHAVDFIIEAVRANPGEITIAAIGPCTNLSVAVRQAPDIVPLIKRVVYMGGSFYQQGNVTPTAEFNWWFDPEATKIALQTPFKEQIIVGLDVCEKVIFRKAHYDRLVQTLAKSGQLKILRSTFPAQQFEKNPKFTFFIWDVIVSAIIIDPSIITEEVTAFVDINDQFGLSYGQSIAYPKHGPQGSLKARIIMDVNQDKLWNMINDKTYWKSAR
ncbi:nucleoside hydrolase [Desulfovibrio sp. OttesenSCG-928-C14]|nr:nucleoside hydrolase [Desulfovibrio sp. OttesenSCG-928-C14]